jgi:hypothetical protein
MKPKLISIGLGCFAAFCLGLLVARSAEQPFLGPYEYATIRWAGSDNVHLIRPGGKVEIIGEPWRAWRLCVMGCPCGDCHCRVRGLR